MSVIMKVGLVFMAIFLLLSIISASLAFGFASFIGHTAKSAVTGLVSGILG